MADMTAFAEVALLLVMTACVEPIGAPPRQPLIVSFIAVGLIAGPSALDVVQPDAQIGLLSELGIAVMPFLVGIKLDVKLIRSLGAVSVMAGLGQVAFTAFFGYMLGLAPGLGRFGAAVGLRLKRRRVRIFGVAFNPLAVRCWRELGMAAEFDDAADPEFVADLPFGGAGLVVCTIPLHPMGLTREDARRRLVQISRNAGCGARVTAAAHSAGDAEVLFATGADRVLERFHDAADRAVELQRCATAPSRPEIPEIAGEERAET